MKVIIQRVNKSSVVINNKTTAQIGHGLNLLVGFRIEDSEKEIRQVANKILGLRIFADKNDKMNLSVKDVRGELLVIPQFTLYADCHKGNRPSFIKAEKPVRAKQLFGQFVNQLKQSGLTIKTGRFGALMTVNIRNTGPVTIILEN